MTDERDPFDPAGETARELREAVGHEFRSEAEAAEEDARKMALRSRTMSHVAYELMARGDHAAIHAGDAVFSGPVTHTRANLAILRLASDGIAYVNLDGPIVVRILDAQSPRSVADGAGPTSFLAALRELDIKGTTVSIHVPSSIGEVAGRIEAVTPDHVMLDATAATYHIPLRNIAVVVPR